MAPFAHLVLNHPTLGRIWTALQSRLVLGIGYGVAAALRLALGLHVAAAAGFAGFGWAAHLGAAYWAGFGVALLGLVWEHRLARTLDVGLVNRAFFQINAIVSVALLVGVMLELRVVQNALR